MAQIRANSAADRRSGQERGQANRTQVEVDVVVLAPVEPGQPRKILSLGELYAS